VTPRRRPRSPLQSMQAECESTLDHSNAVFERLRADMADWKTDIAKREKQELLAVIAMGFTIF